MCASYLVDSKTPITVFESKPLEPLRVLSRYFVLVLDVSRMTANRLQHHVVSVHELSTTPVPEATTPRQISGNRRGNGSLTGLRDIK